MNKGVIIFILLVVAFSAASPVLASWSWGQPILPCGFGGNECKDYCDLLKLLQNLIDFGVKGVTPILGTLFFVLGGFYIILGAANPGMVSTGKGIMWNTVIGIVIVLTAWLITNTLIHSIANPGVMAAPWSDIQCPLPPPPNL